MEEKNMERKIITGGIPVWEWNGIHLVRIGKEEFVTVKPVAKGIRSLKEAKAIASEFARNNECYATIAYEAEWFKLVEYMKINYSTKMFLETNELMNKEVLLLDSMSEGETLVLAAGPEHCLDEIFKGFISGDDADGEPQFEKLLFLTIKIK